MAGKVTESYLQSSNLIFGTRQPPCQFEPANNKRVGPWWNIPDNIIYYKGGYHTYNMIHDKGELYISYLGEMSCAG